MKKCLLLPVLFFVLSVLINGQTKHIVLASNYEFSPDTIHITVGDTVEWLWSEGMHTTTSDAVTGPDVWDEPLTVNDPVYSIVITTAGNHGYHCTPHLSQGMIGNIIATEPTGLDEQNQFVSKFQLLQNYPNPFNPSTIIKYTLPASAFVSLKVYNSLGTEVATLVNEYQSRGDYSVVFDASKTDRLASGVYFYRFRAGSYEITRKMLLIK